MSKLNSSGMKQLENAKIAQVQELANLIKQPFKANNTDQVTALKKYVEEFKLTTYQMYLYQGFGAGLTVWNNSPTTAFATWLGSWTVIHFSPFPEFINTVTTFFMCFGIAGCLLQKFNTTDFYNQFKDMQILYNWCLKGNKEVYDDRNNNDALRCPEVQEMIKILAPLCPPEFMQAWPKITAEQNEQNGIRQTMWNVGSYMYNRIFQSPLETIDNIKLLQIKIETDQMELNKFDATVEALRYFTTDERFKELMLAKVHGPLNFVKNLIPQSIVDSFSS
jgi:hypothetical protein